MLLPFSSLKAYQIRQWLSALTSVTSLFDNVIIGSVNHPLETSSLLSAAGSVYRSMSGTGRLNSVEILYDVPLNVVRKTDEVTCS